MLYNLPTELIIVILQKLYNYDIINCNKTCKLFNSIIKSELFNNYLLTRNHPLVFNSDDLYCHKCNIHIYKINSIREKYNIWCKH